MRTEVLGWFAIVLFSACVPVEVKTSRTGAVAYRVEEGIVVVQPEGGGRRKFGDLLGKDRKCEPIWLEWSPDGSELAFVAGTGKDQAILCTLDPATGNVRTLAKHSNLPWFPRYSPKGRWISHVVYEEGQGENDGARATLYLVSLETGTERALAKRCGLAHAWSPDGKSIVIVQTKRSWVDDDELAFGALTLVNVTTGTAEPVAGLAFSHFCHVAFSRDGRRIFFSTPPLTLPKTARKTDFALFAFDREKKTIVRVSRPGERVAWSASSPKGDKLLYVAAREDKWLEGKLIVLDEKTGKRTTVGENHGNLFPFWVDNDRVAFATAGKHKRIVARDLSRQEEDLTERFVGLEVE